MGEPDVTIDEESGEFVPGSVMTCCSPRHPDGWRRIEVQAFVRYAERAATVLVLMGAADEVYPSFCVPGRAVWSLNGVPMLPSLRPAVPPAAPSVPPDTTKEGR